jgi:hypothetical protein
VTGPRTMFLITAALAGSCACVPVTTPIHFRQPGAASLPVTAAAMDGSQHEDVVLGPLHVVARAGVDFLEVRIRNTGADAVLVDWNGSSFISPSGRPHGLVTTEWLMEGGTHSMPVFGAATGEARGVTSAVPLWGPSAAAAHMVPTSLHMKQQPLQRIEPGADYLAVLYPAEHLVAGEFRLHPGASLLCDASPAETLPVGLRLRWHGDAGWSVNELAGTLPVRNARRGRATIIR